MDTITDILARPGDAARQLTEMRAALEAVTAQLAAKDAELSELRLAVQRDILSRLDVTLPQLAAATAERDAARAEVARRTTIMQSTAQKAERWIHDTDQFSPRTSAEDMVVQDGQLEELAQIVKALRGDTAPAQSARAKSPMDEPTAAVTAPTIKWEDTAPAGRE